MSTSSVQFPLRLKPENVMRGFGHWSARHRATADVREYVAMVLRTQLERPPAIVGMLPNLFDVTLERIGAGVLDEDGCVGAFKGVRDVVAQWLLGGRLGEHDSDPSIRFAYKQWRCERGFWCVRITVEDESDQPDRRRVVGAAPSRLVEVVGNEKRGRALRGVG